jgi:hypothetical protein
LSGVNGNNTINANEHNTTAAIIAGLRSDTIGGVLASLITQLYDETFFFPPLMSLTYKQTDKINHKYMSHSRSNTFILSTKKSSTTNEGTPI